MDKQTKKLFAQDSALLALELGEGLEFVLKESKLLDGILIWVTSENFGLLQISARIKLSQRT